MAVVSMPYLHLVDIGDIPPGHDIAVCQAKGCNFKFQHPSRAKRVAESYRHIANVLDPEGA